MAMNVTVEGVERERPPCEMRRKVMRSKAGLGFVISTFYRVFPLGVDKSVCNLAFIDYIHTSNQRTDYITSIQKVKALSLRIYAKGEPSEPVSQDVPCGCYYPYAVTRLSSRYLIYIERERKKLGFRQSSCGFVYIISAWEVIFEQLKFLDIYDTLFSSGGKVHRLVLVYYF